MWMDSFKFFTDSSKMSEPSTEIPVTDPTVTIEAVPEPTVPREPVPEPTVPREQVPEPTAPRERVPEPTVPTEPVPEPVTEPVTEPVPEPVTEPVPEPTIPLEIPVPEPLAPVPLPFSIKDLINSCDVVLAKETNDRASVLSFVNMSIDSIKPKLYIWASIGFPSSYMVSTFELTAPATCSDGVRRTHLEYFEYLMNGKMNDWLNSMNAKTSGMYFTFSHNGSSCIHLHISK